MITKNELKYFASLNQKKFRRLENKFLAEGEKIVSEGLSSGFPCEIVLTTNDFINGNDNLIKVIKKRYIRLEVIKNQEFEKISDTKSPQGIAAVFETRKNKFEQDIFTKGNIIVYLDNISDPGNAGTILRTCDWFGIKSVLLSRNSADHLNPKVIRSSMGSIFHLNILENADKYLQLLKEKSFKLICSNLDGMNIFKYNKPGKSVLVLSNESSGPSPEILRMAEEMITIPGKGKAESLNVASAAAIILAELTKG
ncbi:MAG: RNA methyltransferase [Ignavibacterium sp.]|nr:RNA methyltransferase [Ignavibacterium sp.]